VAPVKALVLTVSDRASKGEAEDTAGPAAVQALAGMGIEADVEVVPDGVESVSEALRAAVVVGRPLVLTAGGTGVAARDLTPEATRLVIEREAPGIAEALRAASLAVTPHGMLSRGVAGVARTTLIVNLPGSEKAVRESMEVLAPVLGHALRLLAGDTGH
jgi:molybdenum cofactor synthesis domain-containing protein